MECAPVYNLLAGRNLYTHHKLIANSYTHVGTLGLDVLGLGSGYGQASYVPKYPRFLQVGLSNF